MKSKNRFEVIIDVSNENEEWNHYYFHIFRPRIKDSKQDLLVYKGDSKLILINFLLSHFFNIKLCVLTQISFY